MQDKVWVTRDGRVLLVSQMEDRHLANALARVRRLYPRWRAEYLDRLEIEQTIRAIRQQN